MKTNKGLNHWAVSILPRFIFWVGAFLFFVVFFGYQSEDTKKTLNFSLTMLPGTIVISWLLNGVFRKYFWKKQYLKFSLFLAGALVVSLFVVTFSYLLAFILIGSYSLNNMPPLSAKGIFVVVAVLLVAGISVAINFILQGYKVQNEMEKLQATVLEKELVLKKIELEKLRNQLNPHFLFNTLNTLYGLALLHSDQTADMIIKLSNLMDYLLYKGANEEVLIKEEIAHINDYIALEKIRFSDILELDFSVEEALLEEPIPAQLFLPLVENAFKHGEPINGQLCIAIKLKKINETLCFSVQNTFSGLDKPNGKGIGLENTRKRLSLLYSKEAFLLEIEQKPPNFKVELHLDTNT